MLRFLQFFVKTVPALSPNLGKKDPNTRLLSCMQTAYFFIRGMKLDVRGGAFY